MKADVVLGIVFELRILYLDSKISHSRGAGLREEDNYVNQRELWEAI